MSATEYKKVIVSGNVIEVYYYQFPPLNGSDNENDDYNALDLENTEVEKIDRVEERRQQTVRDSRNKARRLALSNFKSGDKFLTLTFDPKRFNDSDLRDINFVDDEFKKFMKRFNYRTKQKIKYIAVREFHRSGRLHLHMICDWDKKILDENENRKLERWLGLKVWQNGFVDIKTLDSVDNVGAYLIKYMTKNIAVEFFKGKKIYLSSRGLIQPYEYRGHEADTLIQTYNLKQKKEVFTNSYDSEYLGKITYKEYNLNRF